jgi:hypothetical protein
MRLSNRRIACLASVSLLALLWSGCEAKQQTEYVAGISTQVKVPRDLKSVRLSVSVGGVRQFCRGYRVYDGRVQLPRSLGTFALNDPKQSGPITYSIVGYTKDLEDGSEFDDLACNDQVGGAEGARILRRSRQPYVENEILFLPLPLKYSCFDTTCQNDSETCKGGVCVDATTDASTLPKFTPELVDGTGGDCFSTSLCMAAVAPAIPVNPDDCTFAAPNTPSAPDPVEGAPNPFAVPGAPPPGEGLNVEVVYDGGYVSEILDKDPDDGFTIPDPNKPQQFRLAKGLCAMFRGYDESGVEPAHRISAVRASTTCRAKISTQPICQNDAYKSMGLDENGIAPDPNLPADCKPTELKPPKALLLLVVDNSTGHDAFFKEAPEVSVGLSLSDPAFSKTDIGMIYAPGTAADACNAAALPVVPPKLARDAKTEVVDVFGLGPTAGAADFALEGALTRAYAIAKTGEYYKRAVLVIGNRQFGADACPGGILPAQMAADAKSGTPSIDTHAILLALTTGGEDPNQVAVDASAVGVSGFADGRGDKKEDAKNAFQSIVESVATCVYDVPGGGALAEGDVLAYSDPISAVVRTIPHAPTCTGEGAPGNGWGIGGGRVFVCGAACTDYRTTLKNASFVNALFGKPSPAMPVFAHKAACAPKP